jgi:hypothetical protein
MAKGIFRKTLSGLAPDDEASKEMMHGVSIGSLVACEVSRPRNLRHHRLYWALCSKIAESIGAQRENVSDVLKIKTGHFKTVKTKREVLYLPASISFSKMDQTAFSRFYDECCRVVCEEFIPHLRPDELRAQIEQIIGLPVSEAA